MGLIADAAASLGAAVGAGNLSLAQFIAGQIIANFTGNALNAAVYTASVNTGALPAPCTGAAAASTACAGFLPSPPPGSGGGSSTSSTSLALALGLGLGLGLTVVILSVAGFLLLRRRRKVQVVGQKAHQISAPPPPVLWDQTLQSPHPNSPGFYPGGGGGPLSPGGSNYPPLQGGASVDWGNSPRPWAFGLPATPSDTRGVLPAPPNALGQSMRQSHTQAQFALAAGASADYYGQTQPGSPRPPWAGSLNNSIRHLPPLPDSPTRSRLMMSLPQGSLGTSRLQQSNLGLSRSLPRPQDLQLGPYGTPVRPEELDAATPSGVRMGPATTGFTPPSASDASALMAASLPRPGARTGGLDGRGGEGQSRMAAAYGPPRAGLSIDVPTD